MAPAPGMKPMPGAGSAMHWPVEYARCFRHLAITLFEINSSMPGWLNFSTKRKTRVLEFKRFYRGS
jgi:hypothetical protein